MVLRDVQLLEVELVGLDLGALVDHEAELPEDTRDLLLGLAQRMERAAPDRATRERWIQALGREPDLQLDIAEASAATLDGSLELLSNRVRQGTDARPVLGRQLADAAEQGAQL